MSILRIEMNLDRLRDAALLGALVLLGGCGGGSGDPAQADASPVDQGPFSPPGSDTPSSPAADAPENPGGCAVVIESFTQFDRPTEWVNAPGDCDYLVKETVRFESSINIAPGTVIVMSQNAEFEVFQGTLTAIGTADQRIVFRGEEPAQGYWRGLRIFAASGLNQLSHVDIQDGGDGLELPEDTSFTFSTPGGLGVEDSTISMVDVSVSNSGVVGANLAHSSNKIEEFRDNRFFGNALHGLSVSVLQAENLDEQSDYAGQPPNGEPGILISGDTYTANQGKQAVWKGLNAPYRMDDFLIFDNFDLTVEAGASFMVNQFTVGVDGAATINGTAERPVYFGPPPGGTWRGVEIGEFNFPVSINHAVIDQADIGILLRGSGSIRGESGVIVRDTLIKDSKQYGFACVDNASQGVELDGLTLDSATGIGLDPECGFQDEPG